MNWFMQHTSKADALTKSARAVYVVFVEGTDELSKDMLDMLNSDSIREKLESAYFITILLKPDSTAHKEFTAMYRDVPVPAIVFVDPAGENITKTHCTVSSAEDFEQQLDETLDAIFKPVSPASRSFLLSADSESSMGPTTSTKAGLALLERLESEDEAEKLRLQAQAEAEQRIEKAKQLLQQKARDIIQHQESKEMASLEPEDRRVQAGQDSEERQKERALLACKEKMRRDRAQDAADRERIRKQIAADRAECELKHIDVVKIPEEPTVNATADELSSTDVARLHFRLPSGTIHAHTFEREAQFSTVRAYVTEELLPGTGITAFTMVTFYPKRFFSAEDEEKTLDELDLVPSAAITVVCTKRISTGGANQPQGIHPFTDRIINVFGDLLWVFLRPIVSILRYLKTLKDRHDAYRGPGAVVGTSQQAKEQQRRDGAAPSKNSSAKTDDKPSSTKRRGSSAQRVDNRLDSDDEKSNRNANSTQQQ